MVVQDLRITDSKYLHVYKTSLQDDISLSIEENVKHQESIALDFRVKSSAVYSANIEGNSIDLNSFLNSEVAKESFKPKKEIDEISDLVRAYEFAISNSLNESNLLQAHVKLSKTILIKDKQGVYRTDRMSVYDNSGLVYLAVEPEKLSNELQTFLYRSR